MEFGEPEEQTIMVFGTQKGIFCSEQLKKVQLALGDVSQVMTSLPIGFLFVLTVFYNDEQLFGT